MTDHDPVRPEWTCRLCGHPWPCPTAKRDLSKDFDRFPTSFAAYMAQFYAVAIHDAAGSPPADLWSRFMGWLPRPNSPAERKQR